MIFSRTKDSSWALVLPLRVNLLVLLGYLIGRVLWPLREVLTKNFVDVLSSLF